MRLALVAKFVMMTNVACGILAGMGLCVAAQTDYFLADAELLPRQESGEDMP
jgi:hypothetical protein